MNDSTEDMELKPQGSKQEKEQQQQKQFSSSVKFSKGFWENLSSYEKRKRKEIEKNELFTPYIKSELVKELPQELAKKVAEAKRENDKTTEDLSKQLVDDLIIRDDISVLDKIKPIFFNENEPQLKKFYILSDLASESAEAITILPNRDYLEELYYQRQREAREAYISYPLGEALDRNYKLHTPRLKKIYTQINPSATLDFVRSSDPEDEKLSTEQLFQSFGKSSFFLFGGYAPFQEVRDTLFRKRNYDYRSPTLHATWDKNPFKYFTFSSKAYCS